MGTHFACYPASLNLLYNKRSIKYQYADLYLHGPLSESRGKRLNFHPRVGWVEMSSHERISLPTPRLQGSLIMTSAMDVVEVMPSARAGSAAAAMRVATGLRSSLSEPLMAHNRANCTAQVLFFSDLAYRLYDKK